MKSKPFLAMVLVLTTILLSACSGVMPTPTPLSGMPAAPTLSLGYGIKQLKFTWGAVSGATHYQLLENPDSFRLGGINQTITVLFADIRGFTGIAENESPEKVVGLLNQYFTAMTEIIFEHGGTLHGTCDSPLFMGKLRRREFN